MPLLTELGETVVGCDSYKHAAPTELGVFRRHRCYKHAAPTELGGCPGGTVAINMPLLTEVRQEKLGCSEGESPSRLMETSVFRTKEMNGKV